MGEIEEDGPDVELNAMAYDRVGTILWTVCRIYLQELKCQNLY